MIGKQTTEESSRQLSHLHLYFFIFDVMERIKGQVGNAGVLALARMKRREPKIKTRLITTRTPFEDLLFEPATPLQLCALFIWAEVRHCHHEFSLYGYGLISCHIIPLPKYQIQRVIIQTGSLPAVIQL